MESRSNKIIRNVLWTSGVLLIIFSSFTGNLIFANIGIAVMGVVALYFHRGISNEFLDLYKTTNKTFIRVTTPLVGLAFLLGGLIGLLKMIFLP